MTEREGMDWLLSYAESSDIGVRLGLRESGEKIPLRKLEPDEAEDDKRYTFSITDDEKEPESRHEVSVTQKGLNHREWLRYSFITDESRENNGGGNVRLIFEVLSSGSGIEVEREFSVSRRHLAEAFSHPYTQPISADRVAGLDRQKRCLRRFLNTDNSDWGLSNKAGVLLEGPPGTGKTELVIETCEELFGGLPVTISGPEILSKWVGESERLLRRQFEEAKKSRSGVLYIDEIDAIARSRSETTHEHSAQLVAQLLVLLDGVDSKKDSLRVVASTNLAEVLDPALLRPGRLGNQPIEFTKPNASQRQAILHHYLEEVRRSKSGRLGEELYSAAVNPTESGSELLYDIAEKTEGYTGADIEDVITTSVTQLKHDEGQRLEETRIRSIIQERYIKDEGPSITEEKVKPSWKDGSLRIDGDGRVIGLDDSRSVDEVRSLAHDWKAQFKDEDFVLRIVSAQELVGSTVADTREMVISVFRHSPDESICLYLKDFPVVKRASKKSELSKSMIKAMHDELVRWNDENLLIYEREGDESSIEAEHLEIAL